MAKSKRVRTKEVEYEMLEDIIYSNQKYTKDSLMNKINIDIKCKNEVQKKLIKSIQNNLVTFCEGSPGTGKTYLSIAQSLLLLKNSTFSKIIFIKSVTTLDSEALGFLKGTLDEKLAPVMYSFTGNVEKLLGKSVSNELKEVGYIEWMPIAYLRGVSIDNSIIIVDEIQNISIDNIRTILSRIGENSKMILLGDKKQKDIKNKSNSALEFVIDNFSDIEGIGVVQFSKEHIVRNPIIEKFENRFDEISEALKKVETKGKDKGKKLEK